MSVEFVSRSKFQTLPETLCLSCARSWPSRCWFWRLKDTERGLELMGASAVKAEARNADRTNWEALYKVVEHPYLRKWRAAGGWLHGRPLELYKLALKKVREAGYKLTKDRVWDQYVALVMSCQLPRYFLEKHSLRNTGEYWRRRELYDQP